MLLLAPPLVQFGARDSGFSFLGSGGEPTSLEARRKKSEEIIKKTGDDPGPGWGCNRGDIGGVTAAPRNGNDTEART